MSFENQGTTHMLLQRQGAEELAKSMASANAKNRLIEPLPRQLSPNGKWLVNTGSGRIEASSPMMLELGDTIYVEYEPTAQELRDLKAGHAVVVSRNILTRLRSGDAVLGTDKLVLPAAVEEDQRLKRYVALHGSLPDGAPATPAAIPTGVDAFAGAAQFIPPEVQPTVPDAPAPSALASAFSLTPLATAPA
jgi:hypothetical protein